jgi:UDP-glucose 4-epimerase
VLFASSAAVYGNNGEGLAIDEDTAKAPLTPYAADKLASEHYLDFYRRQHGLEPAIFRFFNIFGPRQDPSSPYSGVISIFTQRAQQGLPITVFGDGEQTRDFFYIEDLLALLSQALTAPQVVEGAVNIGWNQAVSLNQLLVEIGGLCGGLPVVRYQAPRVGDIRHSRANNQRLLANYQLPNATPIREGLRRLLAQY